MSEMLVRAKAAGMKAALTARSKPASAISISTSIFTCASGGTAALAASGAKRALPVVARNRCAVHPSAPPISSAPSPASHPPCRRQQHQARHARDHAVLDMHAHHAGLVSGEEARQLLPRYQEIDAGNHEQNDAEQSKDESSWMNPLEMDNRPANPMAARFAAVQPDSAAFVNGRGRTIAPKVKYRPRVTFGMVQGPHLPSCAGCAATEQLPG